MMHHIMGFMLVKAVFYFAPISTAFFADFDRTAFFTDINYIYLVNGADASRWIYLAAGLFVPLLICEIQQRIKKVRADGNK